MRIHAFFSLLAFVGLVSACSPRDPAVLTPQEKADQENRRNRGGGNGAVRESGIAGMPTALDLAFGSYLLDRQSQIIGFLNFALNDGALPPLTTCLSQVDIQNSSREHSFHLDFVRCEEKSPLGFLRQQGRLTFSIQKDAQGNIEVLTVTSAPLDEESLDSLSVTLGKKSVKGSANAKDQLSVQLKKVAENPLRFQILTATTATRSLTPAKSWTILANLQTKTWGELVVTVNSNQEKTIYHNMSSILRYDLVPQSEKDKPLYFDLWLTSDEITNQETLGVCPARQGRYEITFSYKPQESRSKHVLNLQADKIQIRDPKNPDLVSEQALRGCDAKLGSPMSRLFLIDWAQILLF